MVILRLNEASDITKPIRIVWTLINYLYNNYPYIYMYMHVCMYMHQSADKEFILNVFISPPENNANNPIIRVRILQ